VTKHDSEYVYHAVLRQMLQTVFPDVPFNIINAGISGDHATNAIKRFERDVAAYSPDLVVVCFGLNDSRQGKEGLDKYKDSLGIIFEKIKGIGSEA
jgi:lysophospholipase L1-like esterase